MGLVGDSALHQDDTLDHALHHVAGEVARIVVPLHSQERPAVAEVLQSSTRIIIGHL